MPRQNIKFGKLKPTPQPGFVYLLSAVGTNKFKIGKAINVANRIRELQTGCPLKIQYVYHAYVGDASSIETTLHHRFSERREIGEWFTLTPSDIKDCILLMRLIQEPEPEPLLCPEVSETIVFDKKSKLANEEKLELAKLIIAQNLGIEKTILKLWGVTPGGRNHQRYTDARVMLRELMEDLCSK